MCARAIWQGIITFGDVELPVKLFSAVVDHDVHFHLLHKTDQVRLQQRMVNPRTEETVEHADMRKGFPIDEHWVVLFRPDELLPLAPKASRVIQVTRFLPDGAIPREYYDRPYFLAPGETHAKEYRALAAALARKKRCGIARWVMRNKSCAGALCPEAGLLLLITLHRAEEVVDLTDLIPPAGRDLSAGEVGLAEQLVQSLSGRFQPSDFHDGYADEVRSLVAAKQRGQKLPARRRKKPRPPPESLSAALRQSLKLAGARS
jgi:DNA end-binding protein Ku